MKRTTLYYVALASALVLCSMRQAVALDNPPACPGVKFAEDCSGGAEDNWTGGICPGPNGNTASAGSIISSSPWRIGISLDSASAIWGQVQGVTIGGLMASCIATDTTVNGVSAADTTGCEGMYGINYKVRNCY